MTPYTVGLTGGIGTGKSTVADRFAALGVAVVDSDLIAHRLTAPGGDAMPAIRAAFGDAFVAADGSLDRARMRAHVFGDADERRRLEAILHPMIRARSDEARAAARSPYVLAVVPLLLENRRRGPTVQRVLVVACDEALQVERVVRRSGIPEDEVRRILAAQMPQSEKLALADDVLDNSGAPDALDAPVRALHRRYLDAAAAWSGADRGAG